MQPAILTVPVTTHSESSIFMAGSEFVDLLRNALDAKDLHLCADLDLEMLGKETDALCKKMAHCLVCNVQQKVREQKRNNWVFKFVRSNLCRAVAAMTIMGHINSKRVLPNNTKTCVLKSIAQHPGSFVPTDNLVEFEGCYLHHDTVDRKFVRSGKVDGRIDHLLHATKNVRKQLR